ncbi:MAG: transglutaminase-like domain-containing protein [Clostridia bacterium]|nr:transglutaminase-like domain-containing protein [Clostridia bacterium]
MKTDRLPKRGLQLRASLVLFVLLFFAVNASASEITLQETWCLLEQDDRAVGFSLDRCVRTDDGFLYTSNIVLRMGILGGPAQDVKIYAELSVDHDYLARSYRLISELAGKQGQIIGEITDDAVTVTVIDPGGSEYRSMFSRDDDEPLYFKDSFTEYIVNVKGLKIGERHTARVWDYGNDQFSDFAIRVDEETTYEYKGESAPVFFVVEESPGQTTWLVSEDGILYYGYDALERTGSRKVEKEDIPELSALSLDVLLVPGNIRVMHPFRSVKSVIRVAWEDVDIADFAFNDNRQKLIGHTETGKSHEALVEIVKDQRDFAGRAVVPMADSEFAPYLAETRFITPSLPEVKELVGAICGEETDGWLITQKLLGWIYENMQVEMIPQTLTTEEILAGRKGKCVEYAILFAAMARSAGLPTKVAMGERYTNGVWVGHMWNEVWLGEWVAVDASHGQLAPDALLLKFVDSAEVMGTQKVRLGLTGRLGISIEEVVLEQDEELATAMATGIKGQTYTNADYRCRITIPDDYTLVEVEEQGMAMLMAVKPTDPDTQMVLLPFSVPEGTAAPLILSARLPALGQALPGFTLLGQGTGEIAGHPAAVGTWTYEYGKVYKQQNWILINKDCGYLFVFSSALELWDSEAHDFAAAREGFALIVD